MQRVHGDSSNYFLDTPPAGESNRRIFAISMYPISCQIFNFSLSLIESFSFCGQTALDNCFAKNTITALLMAKVSSHENLSTFYHLKFRSSFFNCWATKGFIYF